MKFQTVNGRSVLKTQLFDLSNYARKRSLSVQPSQRDRDAPSVDVDDDWSKLSGKDLYDSCLRSASVAASRKSLKETVHEKSDLLLSSSGASQKMKSSLFAVRNDEDLKISSTMLTKQEQLSYKAVVPVILLAAKVAAVKAVEERFCFLMGSEIGKWVEEKYLQLVDKVMDPNNIFFLGFKQVSGKIRPWEWNDEG